MEATVAIAALSQISVKTSFLKCRQQTTYNLVSLCSPQNVLSCRMTFLPLKMKRLKNKHVHVTLLLLPKRSVYFLVRTGF